MKHLNSFISFFIRMHMAVIFLLMTQSLAFSSDTLVQFSEINDLTYHMTKQKIQSIKTIGKGIELLDEVTVNKYGSLCKSFIISVDRQGSYYLSAFYSIPKEYIMNVYINDGEDPSCFLSADNGGWQTGFLESPDEQITRIFLYPGIHAISFSSETEALPRIAEISMSVSQNDAQIDRTYFMKWQDRLTKKGSSAAQTHQARQTHSMDIVPGDNSPKYKYTGYVKQELNYTYKGEFWLKSGLFVDFETKNPSPNCDTVMYLYKKTDPLAYSWSNDDGGSGYMSRIQTPIHSSGIYVLMIRAYAPFSSGTADIYRDGFLEVDNAVISGKTFWIDSNLTSGDKNYLTCNPRHEKPNEIDTFLWISEYLTTPVRAFNNDNKYGDPRKGYNWGKLSMIKSNLKHIKTAIVAANHPLSEPTQFDLYLGMNTVPDNIITISQNVLLKADGMKSGDNTQYTKIKYNCGAWSGGVTNRIDWPVEQGYGGPWYEGPYIESFDNYYSNRDPRGNYTPRYVGAWNYKQINDEKKAVIEVMGLQKNDIRHAQCRWDANGHMHGYDWESKVGKLGERVFHPRKAFEKKYSRKYLWYYVRDESKLRHHSEMTLQQAVAFGYEYIPPEETFTDREKRKLNRTIRKLSKKYRRKFNYLVNQLNKELETNATLIEDSSPNAYRETSAYQTLIKYCNNLGDHALPLLFRQFLNDDGNPAYILLIDDHCFDRYGHIYSGIVDEYRTNQYTKDGRHIYYSHRNTMVKFAKKIMSSKF